MIYALLLTISFCRKAVTANFFRFFNPSFPSPYLLPQAKCESFSITRFSGKKKENTQGLSDESVMVCDQLGPVVPCWLWSLDLLLHSTQTASPPFHQQSPVLLCWALSSWGPIPLTQNTMGFMWLKLCEASTSSSSTHPASPPLPPPFCFVGLPRDQTPPPPIWLKVT